MIERSLCRTGGRGNHKWSTASRGRPAASHAGAATVLRQLLEVLAQRRSEEHTSELQSRLHLVCRLLLEKKKNAAAPVALILMTWDKTKTEARPCFVF